MTHDPLPTSAASSAGFVIPQGCRVTEKRDVITTPVTGSHTQHKRSFSAPQTSRSWPRVIAGVRYPSRLAVIQAATFAYNAGAISYAEMDDRIRLAAQ